jgi:hypothetical protein
MEFEQEKVLSQDNPGLGEIAESPPAETVPQQEEKVDSSPPESIPYNRFQEVVGKKNELQESLENSNRQIEILTQELLKSKQPVIPQEQPVPVEMPKEPIPDDFPDGTADRDYIRAVNNYDYQMNKIKDSQERMKNAAVEAHARNFKQHQARAAQFVATAPDYYTVAESNPITQVYTDEMKRAIVASPMSPQIAYHLGKNQAEAVRIANSTNPAVEIGMLQAKLSNPAPAKQVSLAPQPITPVGNSNAANEKIPGADKMTYEEYKARMNKKESDKRRNGTWGR